MKLLHIGCGPRLLPGWINIDIEQPTETISEGIEFIQVDAAETLPFHDGKVSAIYSEDFVEHLTQQQQWNFYAECFRVLKPSGWCRTITPNLLAVLADSDFAKGSQGVVDVWHWGHPCVMSRTMLADLGKAIGFYVWDTAHMCDMMPPDTRPHTPIPDNHSLSMDFRKP